MKKILKIAALFAALAVLIWFLKPNQNPPSGTPQSEGQTAVTESVPSTESAAQINKDIQTLDVNDLDKEFQDVDTDLNQL